MDTFYCVALISKILTVCAQSDMTSLAFVIDSTNSMNNEIRQVEKGSLDVYEAVKKSNSSNVKNYILVTFGDTSAEVRTNTEDGEVLKTELSMVHAYGGGDCPEAVFKGITMAAKESLPGSNIYVFTDAAPKDYLKFNREVRDICHKKQIQIVFLLTGKCSSKKPKDNKYYSKYREVALATSGQVFNLQKDDIAKILGYIKARVSDRKATLTCRKFGPGHHKVEFSIDDKIIDVVVSVSGASMTLTGPGGSKVITSDIVKLTNTSIVKITDAKPGVYTVNLSGEGMVTVTGTTNVFFNYGFLGLEVDSLNSTASQPISGEKTHLFIKLSTKEPVILKTAQILDLDENVIMEYPLREIDKKEHLYVTDLFVSPDNIFKIAIEGYYTKSKIDFKRVCPTPVVPQKLPDKITNLKPTVTLEMAEVQAEFESSIKIKCSVNGYPKPIITWTDMEEKTILSFEDTAYEIPYDFISIVTIKKINKNHTYECKAQNSMGQDSEVVTVKTTRKTYFELACPKRRYRVRLHSEVKLICKTEANPPAKIKWYKNDIEVEGDSNTFISKDGTSLTIFRMNKVYRNHPIECRVKHELENTSCFTRLDIIGNKPKFDKNITTITAMKGSYVNISCILLNGDKPITVTWTYKAEGSSEKSLSFTGETLLIKDVLDEDEGYYGCRAKNDLGKDQHGINLLVEYPPSVDTSLTTKLVKRKSKLLLDCWVNGKPKPTVRWYKDSKIKLNTVSYVGSYPFSDAHIESNSVYKCEAENKYGTVNKTITINVYDPVTIEVPKFSTINAFVDRTVVLDCIADGYPKPVLHWEYRSPDHDVTNISSSASGSKKKIQNLQIYHEGFYTCIASNKYGSTNITYNIKVNEPVKIISRPTTFEAIVGDPVLKIPCSTQGRPKPSISWLRNGYQIISDTSDSSVSLNYNVKSDGTLLIYNINEDSSASYECHAKNIVNEDKMTFKVNVHPYTYRSVNLSRIVMLEEGTTNTIECEGANKATDSIRWYKGSTLISPTQLVLKNVKSDKTGLYMCRIFKNGISHTGDHSVWVKVGTKPEFTANEPINIEVTGKDVFLKCDANGKPAPKVSWFYNDQTKKLSSSFSYITKVPGKYLCIVSNEFGTINRTFTISARECTLDVIKDFIDRPPLVLEPRPLEVPKFEICNNEMRIPTSRQISLHCPLGSSFENFKTSLIYAVCVNKKQFLVNGNKYEFSELKCKTNWRPTTRLQKLPCLTLENRKVIIGYTTRRGFLTVYNVCYNKKKNMAIYAEKSLSNLQCTDETVRRSVDTTSFFKLEDNNWLVESFIPYQHDDLYSCAFQDRMNSWNYRRWFDRGSAECSIGKRPLLHPRHLIGLPQGAAYSYVNVVPQIKKFMDNWNDVERRIDLRRREFPGLKVLSGSLNHVPGEEKFDVSYIKDRYGFELTVPVYLWKSVEVITIVQINIPNLKNDDLKRFVFCEDVCHLRTWTRNIAWRSIQNGYIFCCDQSEFFKIAGFN